MATVKDIVTLRKYMRSASLQTNQWLEQISKRLARLEDGGGGGAPRTTTAAKRRTSSPKATVRDVTEIELLEQVLNDPPGRRRTKSAPSSPPRRHSPSPSRCNSSPDGQLGGHGGGSKGADDELDDQQAVMRMASVTTVEPSAAASEVEPLRGGLLRGHGEDDAAPRCRSSSHHGPAPGQGRREPSTRERSAEKELLLHGVRPQPLTGWPSRGVADVAASGSVTTIGPAALLSGAGAASASAPSFRPRAREESLAWPEDRLGIEALTARLEQQLAAGFAELHQTLLVAQPRPSGGRQHGASSRSPPPPAQRAGREASPQHDDEQRYPPHLAPAQHLELPPSSGSLHGGGQAAQASGGSLRPSLGGQGRRKQHASLRSRAATDVT